MNDLHWTFNLAPWRVALTALALATGLRLVRRHVGRAPDRLGRRLELLRIAALAMLAITLLQPERVRHIRREGRKAVAVLLDASGSMTTRDVAVGAGPPVSRADWVEQARSNGLWTPLSAQYEVIERPICAPPADVDGGETGTDLHAALEEVVASLPGLRAVLLLSDGDWNVGHPPVAAAARMRAMRIPIYAVAVGSGRHLPDLAIELVAAPAYGLVEENLGIPIEIRSRMDREVRTDVRLLKGGVEVARAPLVLPPQSVVRTRLAHRAEEPGEADFEVVLPVEGGEAREDNNRRAFRIAFRREVVRVLLVDTLPRWEYRYLRNALIRDPGTEVRCLLFHPDLPRGSGRDYLPAFPASRQELSQFDVVFLGDVGIGPEGLTAEQAGEVRGLVEQQGSGLVFLPGRLGRQLSLTNSPLADLLPVAYDPARPAGVASAVESRIALTSAGRGHLLTQLAPTPEESDLVWRSLPGFFWHAAVQRARAGSEVLGVHSLVANESGRLPLLVVRAAGNGKVLYLGVDSAWRWRRGVEDTYHYRFWGQVARWMAHQRLLAHVEGLRVFFAPEQPSVGDRVRIHATALDAAGAPLEGGAVETRVVAPAGEGMAIALAPVAGGWGLYEGAFTPATSGVHRVRVRVPAAGREVETQLEVSRRRIERVGEPARPDVLRELAAVSGGAFAPAASAAELIERIRLLPEPDPVEQRFRLWCHPGWGAALALLLTVYWCGRKLAGRI